MSNEVIPTLSDELARLTLLAETDWQRQELRVLYMLYGYMRSVEARLDLLTFIERH